MEPQRELKGIKFIIGYNNGVNAIREEIVTQDQKKISRIVEKISDHGVARAASRDRIVKELQGILGIVKPATFTFCNNERFKSSPWFTGNQDDWEDLINLIQFRGGIVEDGGLYVPFSNGCELGIHGDEAQLSELKYVSSRENFLKTFGFYPEDIFSEKEK